MSVITARPAIGANTIHRTWKKRGSNPTTMLSPVTPSTNRIFSIAPASQPACAPKRAKSERVIFQPVRAGGLRLFPHDALDLDEGVRAQGLIDGEVAGFQRL